MSHYTEPEPYAVYYYDREKVARLMQEDGVREEDLDPADTWSRQDFTSLAAARRVAKALGGSVEKRVNIRFDPTTLTWDWEQEEVE